MDDGGIEMVEEHDNFFNEEDQEDHSQVSLTFLLCLLSGLK